MVGLIYTKMSKHSIHYFDRRQNYRRLVTLMIFRPKLRRTSTDQSTLGI